jgi:large repetitive protein
MSPLHALRCVGLGLCLALAVGWRLPAGAAPPDLTPRRVLGAAIGTCDNLTVANGRLYFSYDSATSGRELWVSDGTPEGTHLAADILPGPESSAPTHLTVSDQDLFFTASDDVFGNELWRLHLPTGAASLVRDINPGSDATSLSLLTSWNGLLWMNAEASSSTTPGLWVSNGTALGTAPVSGDAGDRPALLPSLLYATPDALVCAAQSTTPPSGFGLWSVRGPRRAPTRLIDLQTITSAVNMLLPLSGGLLFDAPHPSGNSTLWRTDTTSAGTFRVRGFTDVLPGSFLQGQRVIEWRGDAWVLGSSSGAITATAALWVVRGGAAASAQVVSRWSGVTQESLLRWVAASPKARWFISQDEDHIDLWRTDGTPAGTQRARHLREAIPYHSFDAAAVGDHVCFWYVNQDDILHLSCVDDTATKLTDEDAAPAVTAWPTIGDRPPNIASGVGFDGGLYLCGELQQGRGLWRVDPADPALTPRLLTPPSPSVWLNDVIALPAFALLGDQLLFAGFDPLHGQELWAIDTPGAAPRLVKDILTGRSHSLPQAMVSDGKRIIFQARSSESEAELWITDGTHDGTLQVKNIGGAQSADAQPLAWLGARALFNATTPAHGAEPWVSDGTAAGTRLLKDTFPGDYSGAPIFLGVTTGLAFLSSNISYADSALWVSGGSPASTRKVSSSDPTFRLNSAVSEAVALPHALVFSGSTETYGAEPWVSDGTAAGTRLLRDISPGPASAYPSGFTRVGDLAFFSAADHRGEELWVTDGTPEGTHLVRDLTPGPTSAVISCMIAYQGRLIFSAQAPGAPNATLWITDGTDAGTRPLLAPSPLAFREPCALFAHDDALYVWDHNNVKTLLWVITVDVAATPSATSSLFGKWMITVSPYGSHFYSTTQGVYIATDEPALWFIPSAEAEAAP